MDNSKFINGIDPYGEAVYENECEILFNSNEDELMEDNFHSKIAQMA